MLQGPGSEINQNSTAKALSDQGVKPEMQFTMVSLREGINSADETQKLRAQQLLKDYVAKRDATFGLPESQCESLETLTKYLTSESKMGELNSESTLDVNLLLEGGEIVAGVQSVRQESIKYGKFALHAELVGAVAADKSLQIKAIEEFQKSATAQGFDCALIEVNEDICRAIMQSETLSKDAKLSNYAYVQPSLDENDATLIDKSLFHVFLKGAKPLEDLMIRNDAIIAYYQSWAPGSPAQGWMQAQMYRSKYTNTATSQFQELNTDNLQAQIDYKKNLGFVKVDRPDSLVDSIAVGFSNGMGFFPEKSLLIKLKGGKLINFQTTLGGGESTDIIAVKDTSIDIAHNHYGERRNFCYGKHLTIFPDGSYNDYYTDQFSGRPSQSLIDSVKNQKNAAVFELNGFKPERIESLSEDKALTE